MNLFDSSAIINLCAERRLDPLLKGFTLSLAFYELGNAVWKQVSIHKVITINEANIILEALSNIYGKMRKMEIEDPQEILKIAVKENITFHDATYLYMAMKNGLTLVTDDEKLYITAKKYVKAIKSRVI
ncbi:DNA-binding protein [Candidatus Bathyarchaeota archaeon]|nr:MAG: DNA-binding protein [Candidatus Bathyarchaeota archaeon]